MDDDKLYTVLQDISVFCQAQIDTNFRVMEELKSHKKHMRGMLDVCIELRQIIAKQEERICKLEKGDEIPVTIIHPKKGGGQLH